MPGWAFRAGALVIVGVAAGLSTNPAAATLVQVGSRGALNANLDINWSIFGASGAVLSCFCSQPVGGLIVGLNSSSGEVDRVNGSTPAYHGNFASGDPLVLQPFISDRLIVDFTPGVLAVGTQIQPLGSSTRQPFIGSFTGTMQVLTNDGMDSAFSVSGNSTAAENNSAPFLGVVSTTNDIIGIRFFVDIGNPTFPQAGAVAINQVDVRVAPEPASAAVLGTALLVLLGGFIYRCRPSATLHP